MILIELTLYLWLAVDPQCVLLSCVWSMAHCQLDLVRLAPPPAAVFLGCVHRSALQRNGTQAPDTLLRYRDI